ncbi:hypothetical protein B14911_04434 [Bacillus sp. NRRL B-14911]|uniref:Uncharacterized protein n=1 Tax=Bacillus infantis NRRL B-14911 TaxID=1367477 RepID=U5LFU3_9BACI|nr:hypothetical protein N288_22165 [Bacillus infantis NRRL B-14911]EAR68803.1 hypothetical protein B14911_04434 [Bacillus sp. NRRL B-14911]
MSISIFCYMLHEMMASILEEAVRLQHLTLLFFSHAFLLKKHSNKRK